MIGLEGFDSLRRGIAGILLVGGRLSKMAGGEALSASHLPVCRPADVEAPRLYATTRLSPVIEAIMTKKWDRLPPFSYCVPVALNLIAIALGGDEAAAVARGYLAVES
jgi:hypothetical protein